MFCHQYWEEKIEFKTFSNLPQNDKGEGGSVVSKVDHEVDWYMPCSFDDKEKELFAYYILYNMTLGPSNMFTSPDKSLQVDDQLL